MPTLLTIRPPEDEPYEIAISGTGFVDPHVGIDKEIDTSHLWALPGLADAHAHLTMTHSDDLFDITEEQMLANIPTTAWAHVEGGVLLILDKGGASDLSLVSLDHDADRRPFIEAAGAFIHPKGGYSDVSGVEIEPDELIDHLRTHVDTRGGWVKLIGDWPRKGKGPVTNYPVELLCEAVDVIHSAGARVAIHTMAEAASDAVTAGVDSIEHGPFLTADDIRRLGEYGGVWVPTVANMIKFANLLGHESTGGRMFLQGLDNMRENLPLAEELGVTVLAGTDMAVPHGDVAQEALRLKEYGLSDRAATRATSTDAYEHVGKGAAIRVGETADVVFFEENPYGDVATLVHPKLIIHRGRIISSNT